MNLEIKNVTIKGFERTYYKLNMNIEENKVVALISNDKKAINDFFLKISGVNKIQGEVLFREIIVFDNEGIFG